MTTLTGTLVDSGGNPITGVLYLELSQAGTFNPGGILVTPTAPSVFNLTAGQISGPGPGPYSVYGNDGITPSITFYRLTAFNQYGGQVLRLNILVTGVSCDLGALVIAPTQTWIVPPGYVVAVGDGDKGDVTVAAGGSTWTVDPGAISTTKMGGDVTAAGKALLDD